MEATEFSETTVHFYKTIKSLPRRQQYSATTMRTSNFTTVQVVAGNSTNFTPLP
jgi:hypothetical protein